MQHYVGTKIVQAEPAEQDGEEGYAIVYPDGYESWSPADAFQEAYLPLGDLTDIKPHQQRVIGEKAQLDDRILKLENFQHSDTWDGLSHNEKVLMSAQIKCMREYSALLGERINLF